MPRGYPPVYEREGRQGVASVGPQRPTRPRMCFTSKRGVLPRVVWGSGKSPVLNVSVPDKQAGLWALCIHSPVSNCRSSHVSQHLPLLHTASRHQYSQVFIPLHNPSLQHKALQGEPGYPGSPGYLSYYFNVRNLLRGSVAWLKSHKQAGGGAIRSQRESRVLFHRKT